VVHQLGIPALRAARGIRLDAADVEEIPAAAEEEARAPHARKAGDRRGRVEHLAEAALLFLQLRLSHVRLGADREEELPRVEADDRRVPLRQLVRLRLRERGLARDVGREGPVLADEVEEEDGRDHEPDHAEERERSERRQRVDPPRRVRESAPAPPERCADAAHVPSALRDRHE
jgi:hypothetical protein